jgi:alpha-amylase
MDIRTYAHAKISQLTPSSSCVFWGDLYGCEGPEGNEQPPVSQLAAIVRARKLFAYGELRDYWDHGNCVGYGQL